MHLYIFFTFKDINLNFFSALVTAVAVLLTFITLGTLLYAYWFQSPVIKLEQILNALTLMLTITELFFGVLYLLPCGKKEYYYYWINIFKKLIFFLSILLMNINFQKITNRGILMQCHNVQFLFHIILYSS